MLRWAKPRLDRMQATLFSPTLDAMISQDHPVRLFEEMLRELLDWSAWESHYVLVAGQPPIHPRVMAGAILYGLSKGIRSSRQLEDACVNRLDFMWLTEGRRIDHSTFAGFRTRFADELKSLFKQLNRSAMTMGMILLAQTGLDGTKIRANSSRHGTASGETLAARLAALDDEVEELMSHWATADGVEDGLYGAEVTPNRLPRKLADLKRRQARLGKALEAAGRKSAGAEEGKSASGKQTKKKKIKVPVADPESTVHPNKEGGYAPNYTPEALVDGAKGLIVGTDVLADPAEGDVVVPMVDELEKSLGQKPKQLLADGAYGSGENLSALASREVDALIPVSRTAEPLSPEENPAVRADLSSPVPSAEWAKLPRNRQSKKLDRSAFVYDGAADCYWCPMGHRLGFIGIQNKQRSGGSGGGIYRRYRCDACETCPRSETCVASKTGVRTIYREQYEPLREAMESRLRSKEGQASYRRRSWIAETPFAVIKTVMGVRQFLLRGLSKVKTEWLWICTAYNLNKMVRKVAALRAKFAALA